MVNGAGVYWIRMQEHSNIHFYYKEYYQKGLYVLMSLHVQIDFDQLILQLIYIMSEQTDELPPILDKMCLLAIVNNDKTK